MMLNIHEPRSTTIKRYVMDYLLATSVSEETFADDVKIIYHERVTDPKARVMRFHETGDAMSDMKANGQLLFRALKSTVKFPADLEEPVVLALPEERRHALLSDLAARYDLLAAPIPHESVEDATSGIAHLLKETGEAIQALGPIYEDGRVDENDAPLAKKALKEINDAMAAMVSIQARITAILPDHQMDTQSIRAVK